MRFFLVILVVPVVLGLSCAKESPDSRSNLAGEGVPDPLTDALEVSDLLADAAGLVEATLEAFAEIGDGEEAAGMVQAYAEALDDKQRQIREWELTHGPSFRTNTRSQAAYQRLVGALERGEKLLLGLDGRFGTQEPYRTARAEARKLVAVSDVRRPAGR
jgi:hypothetical protein